MMNMWTKQDSNGGPTMQFIHNRTGIALCAAAAAVVLLGAGCSKQSENGGASTTPPTNTGADVGATERWAEYRSENLEITISYPEGWWVEENNRGGSTAILIDEEPLPSLDEPSDATATVGVTIGSFNLADAVLSYGSEVSASTVVLGTRRGVTRLDYESELGANTDVRARTVYMWAADGFTTVVQGDSGSSVLMRIAENLASGRGGR